MEKNLVERWREVLERIRTAAASSGRAPDAVRLVAVSKFHAVEDIRTLFEAGQTVFGENYVQEALAKQDALPSDIAWHHIGHLQTNKVKQILGRFALLQGVDSVHLARTLQQKAVGAGLVQDILVQVNVAGEAQKSGVSENDLPELADFLTEATNLRWQGLMLIPPFFDDPEGARPYFARLREIAEKLRVRCALPLPELSMGMTGDFEAAIAEGATMVRIGTRIFGPRTPA